MGPWIRHPWARRPGFFHHTALSSRRHLSPLHRIFFEYAADVFTPTGRPRWAWLSQPCHLPVLPRHGTGQYFLIPPRDHADGSSWTHISSPPRSPLRSCRRSHPPAHSRPFPQHINVRTLYRINIPRLGPTYTEPCTPFLCLVNAIPLSPGNRDAVDQNGQSTMAPAVVCMVFTLG